MSILEIVLLVSTALALWIPLLRRLTGGLPRWLDFVPAALMVLMLVQILVEGFQATMTVTYGVVVLLFLLTVGRMIRPGVGIKASRLRSVLAFAGALLGAILLIFGLWVAPLATMAAGEDLSQERWTEAFEGLNGLLAERYAFTEWKQIDWEALHDEYAPRIAAAEAANDVDAYRLALREYLFSIPDGHIICSGEDQELWRASIGGGFGLAVVELDDGSVIAHVLQAGGPAEGAGLAWGAEILEWGGVPADEAIGAVTPIWAGRPAATEEGRRLIQQSLLTRAPVGTEVMVTFRNADQDEPQTVALTAVDDGLEPLVQALGTSAGADIRKAAGEEVDSRAIYRPPEWTILPEGYGYLRVYHVRPGEGDPDFVGIVEEAMAAFVAQDVPGVIVDVRGNPGGRDQLVAEMMGHFFTEPDFYEYQYIDNWLSGLSFLDIAFRLTVEPKEPHYEGPVVVLIDAYTVSSGEGFPLVAQRLPEGHIAGVYGTHGSFGMCCGSVRLPGEAEVLFPTGQAHDADHRVQVEGDHNLQGGVVPDIRVPLTRETVHAMFVEGEDVVLQRAMEALQGP